ncbi:hypothetical protein EXIGLDRAFT_843394 [Exidia glandulosa HHB12029]|uniref:Uncharacterized protein n=1 Tax=Exidia glandulosa HHB12029 TaxID=1314781 RepID=A0A165CNU3_EXIGL|nr:hypothetical protein EXIGLDRAFT_843394 [Exidia glandulosa HHB12029]
MPVSDRDESPALPRFKSYDIVSHELFGCITRWTSSLNPARSPRLSDSTARADARRSRIGLRAASGDTDLTRSPGTHRTGGTAAAW